MHENHTTNSGLLSTLLLAMQRLESKIDRLTDENAELVATVLEIKAHVRPATPASRKADRLAMQKKAIELIEIIGPNRTLIARELGVSPLAMRRWSVFESKLRCAKSKFAQRENKSSDFPQDESHDDE